MKWVIHKSSRLPEQTSYDGPTCEAAKVKGGQIYFTKKSAEKDAKKLSKVNPVGFKVSKLLTNQ